MANETYGVSSIQAHVLRVVRLNEDGSVDYGNAQGTYIFDQLVSLNINPEITEGQNIEQVLASGVTCVKFQDKDRLTGFTFDMELCSWDGELMDVLGLGGEVIDDGEGNTIGYDFGGDSTTSCSASSITATPVSFEIWTKAWDCTSPKTGYAYLHWVFPYVEFSFQDQWQVSNGVMLFTVGGKGSSNASYPATGPHADLPVAITSAGAVFLDDTAPTATSGYVPTPAAP